MNRKQTLQLALVVVVLLAAGAVWFFKRGGGGGDGQFQCFYDLSEKKLFRAPRDAFAPIAGVGGESGDGVEAVVVRCARCGDDQQRVAYLKTHTPEYKRKREESRQTGTEIAGLTRPWISENTLVRRPDGGDWRKASSPEGEKIVSDWRRRCPTHGDWEKPLRP